MSIFSRGNLITIIGTDQHLCPQFVAWVRPRHVVADARSMSCLANSCCAWRIFCLANGADNGKFYRVGHAKIQLKKKELACLPELCQARLGCVCCAPGGQGRVARCCSYCFSGAQGLCVYLLCPPERLPWRDNGDPCPLAPAPRFSQACVSLQLCERVREETERVNQSKPV